MAALGAAGIATSLSGGPAVQAQAPPAVKQAPSEVEALRREIELLKLNLRVTLEKLDALEKRQGEKATQTQLQQAEAEKEHERALRLKLDQMRQLELERNSWKQRLEDSKPQTPKNASRPDVAAEIEGIAKLLREVKGQAEQEKLIKALEQAIRKLHDTPNPAAKSPKEKPAPR